LRVVDDYVVIVPDETVVEGVAVCRQQKESDKKKAVQDIFLRVSHKSKSPVNLVERVIRIMPAIAPLKKAMSQQVYFQAVLGADISRQ
jgi:hypothetical protein